MNIEINYEYRTGIGTDIHRLAIERDLMLGGVHVPYHMGLLAHSDGDVVLHAVIDAMLGAAAMGDIGTLFPDSEEKWKDADSKDLVLNTHELIQEKRWDVVNVDVIIRIEEPKLGPFKGQMKRCIAGLVGADFSDVNVKAKTNEGLGEIGAGHAIAAMATVLLRRKVK